MALGDWWWARDKAPAKEPGVVARRKAYADVQRDLNDVITQGRQNLNRTSAAIGAGTSGSNRYMQGANRMQNAVGIDWQRDLVGAMERARAKQAMEARIRQATAGQIAGDVLSMIPGLGIQGFAQGQLGRLGNLSNELDMLNLGLLEPGITGSYIPGPLPEDLLRYFGG